MVGTKWYKCDLHLHTPASKCFEDKSITPEQWVQAAIEKGLDCVAITDHNSADWVDKIQGFAKDKGLWVFPGVELTCSDAKVHLLILFDIGTSKTIIEDFLTICRIDRAKFGETDAHSALSVEEVINEASAKNAICIPAHIDDYSSLNSVAFAIKEKLLNDDHILGCQAVHIESHISDLEYNKEDVLKSINLKFGVSEKDIEDGKFRISLDKIKEWRNTVQHVKKHNKAILTFSDNQNSQYDSKHGLWGIGNRFSWIKLDQTPSLESLRQALILHQFRIKNDFESPVCPYETPDTWIKSISIKETELSKNGNESVVVEFNPQMNTIIGGRGSGKSSILHFIRGVFKKGNELYPLTNIYNDFNNFFKIKDKKQLQGVLKAASEIEIIVNRNDELFKIRFRQLNAKEQETKIFKFNPSTDKFDLEQDLSYLQIFDFDIYSQKQIYEVANNINSLRDIIDDSSNEIKTHHVLLQSKKAEYIKLSATINELRIKAQKKGLIQSEILDISGKIDAVKETGIENELKKIQDFNSDNAKFTSIIERSNLELNQFVKLIESIRSLEIRNEQFATANLKNLESVISKFNLEIERIAISIETSMKDFSKLPEIISSELLVSPWQKDKATTEESFSNKKEVLLEKGIIKIDEVEEDVKKLTIKKTELDEIVRIEVEIKKQELELAKLKNDFITERQNLSIKRKSFLDGLLIDGKVRAKVLKFSDYDQLEEQLRFVFSSPDTFTNDITNLLDYWSGKDPIRANKGVYDLITTILSGDNNGDDFEKRFISKITTLNGEQLNSIDLMFPEDIIQLEYKTNAGVWKTLSNASAGQKTAAILTLILSQGKKPLILDQPEDDLDNYLIYDLVVDQLRKSKETRQIIAVTHNANIPVNGDSEVIIVMDSETKHLSPKHIGTIEENDIKRAVCSIMEGGTDAFEMRSKRYQNIKS